MMRLFKNSSQTAALFLVGLCGILGLGVSGCGDSAEKSFDTGVQHARRHQWIPAAKAFEETLKKDPDLIEAHFALGKVLYHLKNYQKAAEEYEKGLERVPNSTEAMLSLGMTYFEMKRYKDAIRLFHKAMVIKEDFIPAIYGMGRIYWLWANEDKSDEDRSKYTYLAITYLLKAVETNPDYFLAHELLGEIYEKLALEKDDRLRVSALEQAIRYYNQASVLRGGNEGILAALIRLHSLLGDYEKVRDISETMIVLAKVNGSEVPAILLAYKGRSHEELGETAKARRSYELFVKIQKNKSQDELADEERAAVQRHIDQAKKSIERLKRK